MVFAITSVTYVPGLRKIGQKLWSLSWTSGNVWTRTRIKRRKDASEAVDVHSSDFMSVQCRALNRQWTLFSKWFCISIAIEYRLRQTRMSRNTNITLVDGRHRSLTLGLYRVDRQPYQPSTSSQCWNVLALSCDYWIGTTWYPGSWTGSSLARYCRGDLIAWNVKFDSTMRPITCDMTMIHIPVVADPPTRATIHP